MEPGQYLYRVSDQDKYVWMTPYRAHMNLFALDLMGSRSPHVPSLSVYPLSVLLLLQEGQEDGALPGTLRRSCLTLPTWVS